jgi:hypothetical protein
VKHRLPSVVRLALPAAPLAVALALLQVPTAAQDRLKTMPGYQQYQKMLQAIPGAVKLGSLGVTWSPDGKSFDTSTTANAIASTCRPAPRPRSASPRHQPDGGRGGGGAAPPELPSAEGNSIRRHRQTAGRRPSIAIETCG